MSTPRGPTDWPAWLVAIIVTIGVIIWILTLTGYIHP